MVPRSQPPEAHERTALVSGRAHVCGRSAVGRYGLTSQWPRLGARCADVSSASEVRSVEVR